MAISSVGLAQAVGTPDLARPSSTRRFVESVTEALAKQAGLSQAVFDIEDLGSSLAAARSVADLAPAARAG